MQRPIRSPRLLNTELGARKVALSPIYKAYKKLNASELDDLGMVRTCILKGHELPSRFYRPKSGYQDRILTAYGILHLHLGGDTSDTILFLQQFADRVVFLETNSHQRFKNECRQFLALHDVQAIERPTVIVRKRRPPLER
ncbi:MAG: hypothetical protein SFV19_08010 [Rhodospirillaceae bacterium]|nr:hypothetical protein [Rhodospirillaceae bacterium]